MKNILITGSAGFIGFHLTKKLLNQGHHVTGIDNLNNYYDPELKKYRLDCLDKFVKDQKLIDCYSFIKTDISEGKELDSLFKTHNFNIVINLAAQAGVRYSLENPKAYINSNLVGFSNILECCRKVNIDHLIFASSSSVYGLNTKQPFSVSDNTDYPISLYAATKKSNELLAHSYSHLFELPCTGLRFFTVYGPMGRPDMAYYKFVKAIEEEQSIDIYNYGKMKRDFTYIDDIVDGIHRLMQKPPSPMNVKSTTSKAPFKVYNIGNNNPVKLEHFISAIESSMRKKALKNYLPMQAGDVPITYANIDEISSSTGFMPSIKIEEGIEKFVNWYKEYNQ